MINGSGTFDAIAARRAFGEALSEEFPFAAFVSKTITLRAACGQPAAAPVGGAGGLGQLDRAAEPGACDGYLAEDLPELARWLPVPLITNVMGSTAAEIAELVQACDARAEIAAIELNVSCPNVHDRPGHRRRSASAGGGRAGGASGHGQAADREADARTPPTWRRARARRRTGGADAVSLINTLRALALAPRSPAGDAIPTASCRRRRWLGGGTGGLSGPAIRTVALAQVAAVAARVEIPVIGMGGVQSAAHAQDLLDVGATLVAVGTESFRDPLAGARIARDLAARSA